MLPCPYPLPYKYKSVDIPYDVNDALAIAVRDWVLSEYQEVTEHHKVCCGESGVRMAEQVSTATRFRASCFFLVTLYVRCGLEFDVKRLFKKKKIKLQCLERVKLG